MKQAKQLMSKVEKKDLRHVTCEKCGQKYETYTLYFKGENKGETGFCKPCSDREFEEKIRKEMEENRKKATLNKYTDLSEIPFEIADVTFDDYEPKNKTQEQALETVQYFLNENIEQTTLFFQGDTGLGKTHLSYCCYKEFQTNYKPSIFIDLPTLLSKIRNTYNTEHPQYNQDKIMNDIKECNLFVLDDVGAEYVKPDANGFESWVADILFQIVNMRQGKKNIYTTNFESKFLIKKYGMMSKRILSRMMFNAKVIKVEGEDHRLGGLN